jgi:hypothetical protein
MPRAVKDALVIFDASDVIADFAIVVLVAIVLVAIAACECLASLRTV